MRTKEKPICVIFWVALSFHMYEQHEDEEEAALPQHTMWSNIVKRLEHFSKDTQNTFALTLFCFNQIVRFHR